MNYKYTLVCMFMWAFIISGCTTSKQPPQSTEIIDTVFENGQQNHPQNKRTNTLIAFFWDVELRYITEEQLDEILKALQDMSVKSVDELQKIRYTDFNGAPNEWTLLQLVHAYFVPTQNVSLEYFYNDLDAPEARKIIRETLSEVKAYRQSGKQTPNNSKPVTGW